MAIVHDFTKGPLFKPLVLFSLPFMLSNGLQVLYSLVDMIVVGHCIGATGLAAVSNASRMFIFLTFVSIGFSMAGQIYVAQLVGQGRLADLNRSIGTLFSFLTLLGVLITVLGLCFAQEFLTLMQVPAESFSDARAYLMICTSGIVFSFGYNMISAVMRGLGDSLRPLLFIGIASAVNLVLDLLFIIGCGWGVAGAGLATIIGQIVSFVFAVFYLYRRREQIHFDFRRSSFRIHGRTCHAFLRLGIPCALRFSLINISMMFVLRMINGYGAVAAAVFGVGCVMDDTVQKLTQGIIQACTSMVGQNWGARRIDRIRRMVLYGSLYSSFFYLAYGILLVSNPRGLFSLVSDSPEVLDLAPVFAHAIVWSFPGYVLMRGTNGFIHGIGAMNLSLAFGLLDSFFLRIGLSWFLGTVLGLGFYGYVLGFGLACYGMGGPALLYFLFYPWQKRRLSTIAAES